MTAKAEPDCNKAGEPRTTRS